MKFFLTSTALLSLANLHLVGGAVVEGAGAVKEITLNIANAKLAPDGFLRSAQQFSFQVVKANTIFKARSWRTDSMWPLIPETIHLY